MGKRVNLKTDAERVYLVVELVQYGSRDQGYVGYICSLPGRESVLRKTWAAPGGLLDEYQLRDMAAAISDLVQEATLTWTGAQGVLPMA